MYNAKELARLRAEDQDNGGMYAEPMGGVLMEPIMSGADGNARYSEILPGAGEINPKTLMGAKKPDLSLIPAAALLHESLGMMNGAEKYGPFNWRDQAIPTRTYVAAAMRHLQAYMDGEEFSQDTVAAGRPVHHLAHVRCCAGILLDAMECGTLIDDRPVVKGRAGDMVERYNKEGKF